MWRHEMTHVRSLLTPPAAPLGNIRSAINKCDAKYRPMRPLANGDNLSPTFLPQNWKYGIIGSRVVYGKMLELVHRRVDLVDTRREQVVREFWRKIASPSCHPSRRRMDSSDLGHHLIRGSVGRHESVPQTASRSVHSFSHSSPVCQHTHIHTNIQTTLSVTSIAIGHIYVYVMHTTRPNNYQLANAKQDQCFFCTA